MKLKFYLNRFIFSIFGTHLFIYLCWAFIKLSLSKPIYEAFATSNSRGVYIAFLLCVLFCSAPFYLPFEDEDENNL